MFSISDLLNWGPDDRQAKAPGAEPFGRIPPDDEDEPEAPALRTAWKQKDPAPLLNGINEGLKNDVGPKSKNDRNDVSLVQGLMGAAGVQDQKKTDGPTGYYGERDRQDITAFQKANGLKQDGWLKPGGPTFQALKSAAGEQARKNLQKQAQNPPKAQQTTLPDGTPLTLTNSNQKIGDYVKENWDVLMQKDNSSTLFNLLQGAAKYINDQLAPPPEPMGQTAGGTRW